MVDSRDASECAVTYELGYQWVFVEKLCCEEGAVPLLSDERR